MLTKPVRNEMLPTPMVERLLELEDENRVLRAGLAELRERSVEG